MCRVIDIICIENGTTLSEFYNFVGIKLDKLLNF